MPTFMLFYIYILYLYNRCLDSLHIWNKADCVFQVAGLQYKKFLAFPWILTVTWPLDSVNACFMHFFYIYLNKKTEK